MHLYRPERVCMKFACALEDEHDAHTLGNILM